MTALLKHSCPGCGAPGVDVTLLACKPCWQRLPDPFRGAVTAAYTRRQRDWRNVDAARAHGHAVLAAERWYEAHPVGGAEHPGGGP